MTNKEFLDKVQGILKERHISKYKLIKKCNPDILKESTVYSMFDRESAAKLEYVFEISRALNIPVAELIEIETDLTPVQRAVLSEFSGYSDEVVMRALPIIRGVLLTEKAKEQ